MQDVLAFVTLMACLTVFVVSVVSLIRPTPRFWMPTRKRALGGIGVAFGFFVLTAIIMPKPDNAKPEGSAPKLQAAVSSEAAFKPEVKEEKKEAVPDEISLTGPQQNAVRSAENYLSMTGFSRDGLIQQLSSDAGDGYDVGDATVAVDSLDVDWKEEAVRSAKNYLSMSGFSCNGLIEQLSSSAGDKYTRSQATYGAKQAGAC